MSENRVNPPPVEVDWRAVSDSLTNVLRDELVGVLEGAQADINNFLVDISHDLTRAMRVGKTELTDELRNQALALVELNRLRIAGTHLRVLDKILSTAIGIGSSLLGNVIGMAISSIPPART